MESLNILRNIKESEKSFYLLFEETEDLLEKIPDGPAKIKYTNILDNISLEDTIELKKIHKSLESLIARRKTPNIEITIYAKNKTEAERTKIEKYLNLYRENLYHTLKVVTHDPGSFLGNGSVAEAYNVPGWGG